MTALISCDGCGAIVSDRPDDDDPTAEWWLLSKAPLIGGGMGLLPMIPLDLSDDFETPSIPLPPPEPNRHFCTLACLAAWAGRLEPAG